MRILILGSSGQIGSSLSGYLKKLNHEVTEFDIASDEKNDLRIPHILDHILPDIDFVFFLAFDVGGSIYLKTYQDSYEFISNNIRIMNNTFESLSRYSTPFIFTSSQMSMLNHSSYGVLKNIGEKYTRSLNGKIARLWNVYGFEKYKSIKSHVITDFILMAKEKNKIDIKTTGEESRQFLYADDCCKCLNILMNKFNEIEEKEFDVTNFSWMKISDVAKIISSFFNNCPVSNNTLIDDIQRNTLREPSNSILSYWIPETNLREGIHKIINMVNQS